MLDIRYIRENPELLQRIADQKGIDLSIEDLIKLDETRRTLIAKVEQLRNRRNGLSQEISSLLQKQLHDEAEKMKTTIRSINKELDDLETSLREVEKRYMEMMLLVPNVISPDTPIGESDKDNVEIYRRGEIPQFDFPPLDHVALGEKHKLFDIPRGVKVAGTRQYFLTGMGVALQRAVQQLAIDLLVERGFTLMDVPVMVREENFINTGFFPLGRDQCFKMEDNKYLIGTSEVSLISYYSNEIVDVTNPILLAGVSNCFRSEVGSAGKDVHGLYRVHQFSKVEQVVICKNDPDVSEQALQMILKNAEDILNLLELPYRVVMVCTGDMGQGVYKKYDIETWMPSRNAFGETHSASNLWDFQARRSRIRYRDENGKTQFCHTLNNTAVALPRLFIPLLEVHQQSDGSIYVPKALRKYLNGIEYIG